MTVSSGYGGISKAQLPNGQLPDLSALEVALAKEISASDLRQVLIDAPIALAIVTMVALALGWLAAGRVLRPLAVPRDQAGAFQMVGPFGKCSVGLVRVSRQLSTESSNKVRVS